MGYSRAVVAGDHVYVAGTAPIPRGRQPIRRRTHTSRPDSASRSSRARSSGRAPGSRTSFARCVYLTDASAFDEMARAHGEVFGDIRPVNTTVVIAGLVDPRWLLEMDVVAVLSD